MALEHEENGTAQIDPATAPNSTDQTPNHTDASPVSAAQTTAQVNAEKELQRLRSQAGRELAEARRLAEQARLAAEQIRGENRQLRMRDMSDAERLQFERDEAIQFANSTNAELQAERQRIANAAQRAADMQQVSDETGIPVSELAEAESFDAAWKLGVAYMKNKSPAAQQEQAERAAANAPFVGGGRPNTPVTRKDKAIEDAFLARDAHSFVLELLNS